MPVYLFTYHTYGSWMPDRPQGYVRYCEGVLPPDPEQADRYRRQQRSPAVVLQPEAQQVVADAMIELCAQKAWRLHQIATDPSHIHILVSWRCASTWKSVQRSLRYHMSNRLNATVAQMPRWFSRNASRRRVRDRAHFDHLMCVYLPSHRGICWREGDG